MQFSLFLAIFTRFFQGQGGIETPHRAPLPLISFCIVLSRRVRGLLVAVINVLFVPLNGNLEES